MHDAPVSRSPRFSGRVQNERVHDNGIPGRHYAGSWRRSRYRSINFVLSQNAEPVRARNDIEATSLLIDVIKVQTNRHHLLQHGSRGLGMVHAVLPGPWSPSSHLYWAV